MSPTTRAVFPQRRIVTGFAFCVAVTVAGCRSGSGKIGDTLTRAEAGFDGWLSEPVNPDDLFGMLAHARGS
jgi:hypothetical protein